MAVGCDDEWVVVMIVNQPLLPMHCAESGCCLQWLKAYPKAKGYGCPGLKAKLPDAGYAVELSTSNQPPPEWKGEIEHTFLGYEHNPFTGKPFFNEVS